MATILILMEKEKDRQLLYEYLRGKYLVALERVKNSIEPQVDLCIVDGLALQQHSKILSLRKTRTQEPYLPILLVTARKDVQLITRSLWKIIDDIITTPIEKRELHARVEVLIRSRQFSLELLRQKEKKLKQLRKELLETEALQSILINATPLAVFNLDPQGNVLSWNTTAQTMCGWAAREILGQPIPLFRDDQEKQFREILTTIITTSQPIHGIEILYTCKDSSLRYGLLFGAPVYDLENNLVSILFLLEDISERKRFELELAEREENYRKLFYEHAAIKLLIDPATGNILDANKSAEQYYGWSRDELMKMKIKQINTLSEEEIKTEMERARTLKRVHFEFRHRRADGSIRDVEVFSSVVPYHGKEVLYSIIHDVTEGKIFERELHRLREQYERFFNEDLAGVFLATAQGKLINCNPAFVRIFGFSSIEEALQTNLRVLFQSPEEQSRIVSQLLKEKRVANADIKMMKRDGSQLFIVANIVGHFDDKGELTEIQGYFFDDTIRRKLEERIRESQKFESLGTVASGIAHDFNNILGIIMGHVSLLPHVRSNDEKFSQSVSTILSATERGANMVKQMLTFARKTETILKALNVNDVIQDMVQMLQETFPKTIEISTQLDGRLPLIIADETQIHQVILNLAINARDAMPKGGTITFTTKMLDANEVAKSHPLISAEKYVAVTVSDTGTGMEECVRKRIFEPFFTTKPKGKGTGLGLAVVYGIVVSHNGFIDVWSEPGVGTAFTIYFPAAEKAVLDLTFGKTDLLNIPGGTERVLIVEDEEALRQLLRDLLESKGYSVLCANDGIHALELYREHNQEIDVVISDVGLPKLGGEEIFKMLKQENPNIKVILASGYIDPLFRAKLLNEGVCEFIAKPYKPEDVLLKLRKVVEMRQ